MCWVWWADSLSHFQTKHQVAFTSLRSMWRLLSAQHTMGQISAEKRCCFCLHCHAFKDQKSFETLSGFHKKHPSCIFMFIQVSLPPDQKVFHTHVADSAHEVPLRRSCFCGSILVPKVGAILPTCSVWVRVNLARKWLLFSFAMLPCGLGAARTSLHHRY